MSRHKFSNHTFDMNEYFSGERFVVGGLNCDWETPEEGEAPKKNEVAKSVSVELPNKAAKTASKKPLKAPEVN